MPRRKFKKLNYSISEVSQISALKPYVLRYWETEFKELRPKKDRSGNRAYRIEDIKTVFVIKKLLYEEKYTIEGARQQLKKIRKNGRQMDLSLEKLRREDALHEIKKGLRAILNVFEESKGTNKNAEPIVQNHDDIKTLDYNPASSPTIAPNNKAKEPGIIA